MAESNADRMSNRSLLRDWKLAVRERWQYVPNGESLPEEHWRARHRNILLLLAAHAPFLFLLGTFDGVEPYVTGATFEAEPLTHVLLEVGAILGFVALAWWPRLGRRTRTAIASTGLMTCSAILAHLSGGFIEAHFHFFVMVGVVAAYEDWLPFVVAILYVAVEHGVFGMIDPEGVYNHPAAIENPWGWALIHAIFVLGLAAALVSHWFSIERSREETRQQIEQVEQSAREIEDLEEKQAEIEAARAEAEEAMSEAEARKREVEELNEQLLVHADEIATAMDAVSSGDLTADPPRETDIEAVAAISEAFDEMTTDLSATVLDLREFAATVERTTRSVHDDAEALERTQQELADDIRAFAADLREQAGELESTTGELSTLSATIEEIAANADQVSVEAGDAADAAQSGTDTAAEAIEAIEAIEDSVGELADLVDSLDGRMDDVTESTGLIEDIAEQTNMLALNANIEAARAQNDSDGFAVVADEVKELADETRDHSTAIQQAIEGTVGDVERVQAEMAETKARIETGRTTMTDAGAAFEDLADTVESVDTAVDEVAAATDDGARTTEAVVDAIEQVAERSRTVADRSESLADRTEQGASTISGIRRQLDDLTRQTADLQERLDAFECETTRATDTDRTVPAQTD